MKKKLLLWLQDEYIGPTIKFLAIGIALILASLLFGKPGSTFSAIARFAGAVFFFYGTIRYWAKALYYAIMGVVFILLIVLEFLIGIDIFIKAFPGGHNAEDMLWLVGGIFLAGAIAGIAGIFSFFRFGKE